MPTLASSFYLCFNGAVDLQVFQGQPIYAPLWVLGQDLPENPLQGPSQGVAKPCEFPCLNHFVHSRLHRALHPANQTRCIKKL